jgi:hypothetical protein
LKVFAYGTKTPSLGHGEAVGERGALGAMARRWILLTENLSAEKKWPGEVSHRCLLSPTGLTGRDGKNVVG